MKDYKTVRQLSDEFNIGIGQMRNILHKLEIHKVQFLGKTSAYYYNYTELKDKLKIKGIRL